MKLPVLLGLVSMLFAIPSYAVCHKQQVCDGMGNCEIEDICQSTLDLPSVEVDPIMRPYAPSIQPIQMPIIPPIGTTSCRLRQVNGYWQNVCN